MRILPTLILITVLLTTVACDKQPEKGELIVVSGLTMGTVYNIKIVTVDDTLNRELINREIEKVFNETNRSMSTYDEDSELSSINRSKDSENIPLSQGLYSVLDLALEICKFTNGAFDVTIGPLVNLWGFGPVKKSEVIPDQNEIRRLLDRTGCEKLELGHDRGYIRKLHPDIYIDLSGIAKGYGVDKIAEYLESLQIQNYLVEVGGEIRARGINEKGRKWRIGIEKPVTLERRIQKIVQLDDTGMATSGDYRNYFEVEGVRYSHTIDPSTGSPVAHNLVSVTVLDPSAARADALATALLVMGPDKGYRFAQESNISAYFIEKVNNVFEEKYTDPFADCLTEKQDR